MHIQSTNRLFESQSVSRKRSTIIPSPNPELFLFLSEDFHLRNERWMLNKK